MRNLIVGSIAAVSLLCTSSVMAENKPKMAKAYPTNPVTTITRTSDRMAEIIQSELKQILRGAKRDFSEVKRYTRGNYQAEEAVTRLGQSMGTVEDICNRLEQRLLPTLMRAARQLDGHSGGYGNDYHHGGNNHHSNDGISSLKLARLMDEQFNGESKMRVLEDNINYVYMFDGLAIEKIVDQFLVGSRQSRACQLIGRSGKLTLSSEDLCRILNKILAEGETLTAAKALAGGVSDLNLITIERINQRCFLRMSSQSEFRRFALQMQNNHY